MSKTDDFDLQDFLPYLLNQAAETSSLAFQQVYKGRYGMLRTEWRVLFHLGRYGRMTAKEIGQRAKTHKTKISRAVQAVYRDLRAVAAEYDARLVAQFTPDEAAQLRAMLQRLAGGSGDG